MTIRTIPKAGDDDASHRFKPGRGEEPSSVSYLVRFWLEPREKEGESSPFRGYARDLETGEERYFGDPRRFAEHVLRRLRAERQEEARRKATGEIENAAG